MKTNDLVVVEPANEVMSSAQDALKRYAISERESFEFLAAGRSSD